MSYFWSAVGLLGLLGLALSLPVFRALRRDPETISHEPEQPSRPTPSPADDHPPTG